MRFKQAIFLIAIFFGLSCFFLIDKIYSEEEMKTDIESTSNVLETKPIPVAANADSLNFDHEKNIIIGEGNVNVTYKDMVLTCDKVHIDMNQKTIHAMGNVQFSRGEEHYEGAEFTYNYETKQGSAEEVEASFHPWYGDGEQVIRHSPEKVEIKKGSVTTCEYDKPHYYFKAKKILIFPDKKVVAYNCWMILGKVPVLYFPVLYYPLNESAWSIIPGHSSLWGFYLLTSYRWLSTDHVESKVHMDYRRERGFAGGLDVLYKLPTEHDAEGVLKGYAIRDEARELSDGTTVEENRYKVEYEHRQYFSEDTLLRAEINKYSDEDFLVDFFREDSDDNLRPSSFIDLSKTTSKYSFGLQVKKQVNDFYTTVERLPEGIFGIRNQRLSSSRFFYKSQNRLGYLNKEFANDSEESFDSIRFDSFHELSYPKKYFGWLEIVPRMGERGTFYGDSIDGDSIWRGVFHGGIEFGTRAYKIMEVENAFWDINYLRHVIEPRIGYIYVDKPTTQKDEIFQFDLIDAISRRHSVRLSLRNKLQTKRNNANWDLVDFLFYTDYFIDVYEGDEDRRFSNLFFDFELKPFEHLDLQVQAVFDQYEPEFDIFNAELEVYKEGHWNVDFGYRYRKKDSSLATYSLSYTFNEDWTVAMYHRYEIETGELEDQEYTIFKNLHCWDSSLSYRKIGEDKQIFLSLWLRDYPDIPLEIGN